MDDADFHHADPPVAPPSAFADACTQAFDIQAFDPLAPQGEADRMSFLRQALEDLRGEDAAGLAPADLASILHDFYAWTQRSGEAPGADDVRLEIVAAQGAGGRPLGLDVLRIAQPDRPFLVDSVLGELAEAGLDLRAMLHPVVEGVEGRRSLILVLLDPVGDDRRAVVLENLATALADVRAAVEDYDAMRALVDQVVDELETTQAGDAAGRAEDVAFLRWLNADRFVFLGARVYDYPRDPDGGYAAEEPRFSPETSYGVLRDPTRSVLRRASEPAILTRQLSTYLESAEPLAVAKSNLRSRVHRRAYMDYIGVKRYDASGRAVGETRFVGLFTAEAHEEPAREIPLIRRKIAHVLARAGAQPSAHTLKRLRHIVETYPRDELFQIEAEHLYEISQGVLHLYDRPRVRLFARTDPFDRFVSVLLYFPRERYDSDVRQRAAAILARAWNGRVSAYYPSFSADPLARVHFILGVTPGEHPTPDPVALEAEIAEAVRTWRDRFEAEVRARAAALDAASPTGFPSGVVARLLARYGAEAFPAGYRAGVDPIEALADVEEIERLGDTPGGVRVRAFRSAACSPLQFGFKLYRTGEDAVPLADILPILENMGLKALQEEGHPVGREGAPKVWTHEFLLEDPRGAHLDFAEIKQPFEDTFVAVWTGRAESDGFNRLVLELGVGWRDAALIRALARCRQQSGMDPSQSVQEAALRDHPAVARLILDLFSTQFHPALAATAEEREAQAATVFAAIVDALQGVESLDADRALRRLAQLVRALKRTNFYQHDGAGAPKPHISFKVASRELEDLPAPKPYREIFVSSPQVDGVHLRFGPVARGGLRWSDRRDDFRTEVLGLVKAQQVKNAVIVPVGSKGGFYPKQLPRGGTPDAVRAEGIRAYKTFLSGLLDITDDLDPTGAVVRPEGVIALDGDDPYLVVAADKGTATFSDIANGVARDYGFWLDDAFASGGSAGYDHKAMGITARGAWEAVKRHFRELGKDIQREPFTMVGVGDMSGDVFGNGALLSQATKLIAAFDHRHIFLDPAPDPALSWAERRRLFALPRSSWADYDASLISPGGGVFARTAKSVPLAPEVQAWLGVEAEALPPAELIRAILRAPSELLYLGGIGTYVKAATESQGDAGDKTNDAVRIDAHEVGAQVVGEGANLGFTQAGRIAFARQGVDEKGAGGAGGRINTDAIDNSAGVDTSDHEVNIKILLGQAIADGALKAADRDALLASMTDEVAAKVLAHNHAQTLSLSLQAAQGPAELDAQARFMADLVAAGRLDRKVEGLPGPAAIAELRAQGRGLTRPELAVITAYGKLELSAAVVAGTAPDDPYFEAGLRDYFPKGFSPFSAQMSRHRLRREIIATVMANAVVDQLGPTFASRLRTATGADATRLVTAFEAARRIFRLDETWGAVDALDGTVSAAVQLDLYAEVAKTLRAQVFWLVGQAHRPGAGVAELIAAYRPFADALEAGGPALLTGLEQTALAEAELRLVEAGTPEALAKRIAWLRATGPAVEIADIARDARWPVEAAARLFHRAGETLGLDRLRAAAEGVAAADAYERAALRGLTVDLIAEQVRLTRAVSAQATAPTQTPDAVDSALAAWTASRTEPLARARRTQAEIEAAGGGWTFAKLSIAHAALRQALT